MRERVGFYAWAAASHGTLPMLLHGVRYARRAMRQSKRQRERAGRTREDDGQCL